MLRHFPSTRQHHLDHLRIGLALLLRDRPRVNVEGRADVRVTQQFLREGGKFFKRMEKVSTVFSERMCSWKACVG